MAAMKRWVPGRRRGLGGLIGLPFLAYPVADVLHSDIGTVRTVVGLVLGAVWVAMYVAAILARDRVPAVPAFVTLVALATGLTVLDRGGWAALFVFCCVVAAFRLEQPVVPVAGCTVLCCVTLAIADAPRRTTASLTTQTGVIGLWLVATGRLVRANRELEEAREDRVRLAIAEERVRFARDLHDLLGHSLSVIALKGEVASRLLAKDPDRAAAEIADIQDVARRSLAEVREAVTGYRRASLEAELDGAREALSAAGIVVDVRHEDATALPPDVEAVLAWTVREGATNVLRHAGAQHVTLRVANGGDEAVVEVVDDGRGPGGDGDGSGLAGLRERVALQRGRLEVEGGPDGGFRLRVAVPAEGVV